MLVDIQHSTIYATRRSLVELIQSRPDATFIDLGDSLMFMDTKAMSSNHVDTTLVYYFRRDNQDNMPYPNMIHIPVEVFKRCVIQEVERNYD
jgi:hypothetical protein